MKKLISKIALPLGVVALAVVGAFQSNAMTKTGSAVVDERGFIQVGGSNPCELSVWCTPTLNSHFCTVDGSDDGTRVYKKNDSGVCNIALYRIPE
jgi:Family of unknown function (DUF6520)